MYYSAVEAKDLQLQVEQTISKEEPTYAAVPERKRNNRKSTKKERRASPYPNITHTDYAACTADYGTAAAAAAAERQVYEYSSEMAMQMQHAGYSGVLYPGTQDGVDGRYGPFYTSPYGHAGIYSDPAMYSYHRYVEEQQRSAYRSDYEDKVLP